MAKRLEVAALIPRYQKIVLWLLLVSCVLAAAYLIRMRAQARDQLAAIPDAAPMPAPATAPRIHATLLIANDEDGSLSAVQQQLVLPTEVTARARTLLNDLLAEYAKPDSPHPLAAVPAVNDVFLLPVPGSKPADAKQMAVVNLSGNFVDRHPSGILTETLTLLSILGTLHANLPQIAQVRFLVDGQPRDTLAGHVDLTRTYLTANDVPSTAPTEATSTQAATPPRKDPATSQP